MCDQQSLRPACTYVQSDQSLCKSLEYSMIVKLLTEHHLEFLSLKGGCRGSYESALVKMPHCWKSHATAQNFGLSIKRSLTEQLDHLCVCQVIWDNFTQLGKMPTVPFSGSHHVVVQFFVQVIQQCWKKYHQGCHSISISKFPDFQLFSRPFWKANFSHFHPSTIRRFCTNIWTFWFNLKRKSLNHKY